MKNSVGGAQMARKLTNPHTIWRRSVLERDDHQCVRCGSLDRIEADHIKPVKLFPELMYSTANGRSLCHECHKKTGSYGGGVLRGLPICRDPYMSKCSCCSDLEALIKQQREQWEDVFNA